MELVRLYLNEHNLEESLIEEFFFDEEECTLMMVVISSDFSLSGRSKKLGFDNTIKLHQLSFTGVRNFELKNVSMLYNAKITHFRSNMHIGNNSIYNISIQKIKHCNSFSANLTNLGEIAFDYDHFSGRHKFITSEEDGSLTDILSKNKFDTIFDIFIN
jgi:hypothetical protein